MSKYNDYIDAIDAYRKAVQTYQFSKIDVKNAPIEVATEIFTRINIGGKPLTLFEIMAAKTYDEAKKFDLSEKYDALIENLSNVDYDTISSSTVLQAVSVCLVKECTRKSILNLEKQKFIDVWPQVESAFESAVDICAAFIKFLFHNFFRMMLYWFRLPTISSITKIFRQVCSRIFFRITSGAAY